MDAHPDRSINSLSSCAQVQRHGPIQQEALGEPGLLSPACRKVRSIPALLDRVVGRVHVPALLYQFDGPALKRRRDRDARRRAGGARRAVNDRSADTRQRRRAAAALPHVRPAGDHHIPPLDQRREPYIAPVDQTLKLFRRGRITPGGSSPPDLPAHDRAILAPVPARFPQCGAWAHGPDRRAPGPGPRAGAEFGPVEGLDNPRPRLLRPSTTRPIAADPP